MSKDLDSAVPLRPFQDLEEDNQSKPRVPRYDGLKPFVNHDDGDRAAYAWALIKPIIGIWKGDVVDRNVLEILTEEFAHCREAYNPKDSLKGPGESINTLALNPGGHFIREYLCGHTKDQCRCPSPNKTKTVIMELCPGCVKNPPKKNLHDGRYYVGIGSDPNHPAIVAGPFDAAIPVMDGHTLYVYHHKYGFVKVE